MKHIRRSALVASALLAAILGFGTGFAQTSVTPGTLYTLTKGSSYEFGCFGPCLCPVLTTDDIRGTFRLARQPHVDGSPFETFTVSEVQWKVKAGDRILSVTGSGTYERGGEFALEQRLALTLTVNDEAPQFFDSGRVPGGGDFPKIDVTISAPQNSCVETKVHVGAAPVGCP